MPNAIQPCAHLSGHGHRERRTITGNITVELCRTCARELDHRLAEVDRAETPIEQAACTEEVAMQQGCTYEVRIAVHCRAVCDAGQQLCPRHIVVAAADERRKAGREKATEVRRKEAAAQKRKGRAA
jgi:hypothetical protein